jgi:site-specific recombinase XerD
MVTFQCNSIRQRSAAEDPAPLTSDVIAPNRTDAPNTPYAAEQLRISTLLPYFEAYCRLEWGLAPRTVQGYVILLRVLAREIGDVEPHAIGRRYAENVRKWIADHGWGFSYANGLLSAIKAYGRFCREALNLGTIEPADVRYLPKPKREVVFLSKEEIARFVAAIPHYDARRPVSIRWLSFRALVEVLLSTGMRIAECLSLTRYSIDRSAGAATIVGKGSKPRTVYFTPRAQAWVDRYLRARKDSTSPLFVTFRGRPLTQRHLTKLFRVARVRSGIEKQITAHTLRHTVATQLLFSGCPINLVKDILGHNDLETTCNYYLGTDIRAAKQAFDDCLRYEV